jgi:hypothetical protein
MRGEFISRPFSGIRSFSGFVSYAIPETWAEAELGETFLAEAMIFFGKVRYSEVASLPSLNRVNSIRSKPNM